MTAASDGAQPAPGSSSIQDMSHRIADEARSFADGQKGHGAERLTGVAQAIHNAADQIGKDVPQVAGYIHEAASRLEQASSMVRERSLEDLVGLVDDFARRQPAAFFGGSVVAGFLLSRFLMSSNNRRTGVRPASSVDFSGRAQ